MYNSLEETRVCFYISDKIDPDSWEISHSSKDLIFLHLKIKQNDGTKTINIHNVYNSSSVSYASIDSPSTLQSLQEALRTLGEHIVLGDFNLHHRYWCGAFRLTQHAMADILLDIIANQDMDLTLPRGTITWEKGNSFFSTIDLVFVTDALREALVICDTDRELDQSSDRLLIVTKLQMAAEAIVRKRRAWKAMDKDKLLDSFGDGPPWTTLTSR